MTASPDQIGSIGGQEVTVSDILNGLMTAQDEGTHLLIQFYQENPEIVEGMSNAFKYLGVAGGAVLTALEEYQQGLPLSTVVPDSLIDAGLSYLTADGAAVMTAAGVAAIGLTGGLAAPVIVGAAVVGGFLGHIVAQDVNAALSDVENGPDGAAARTALNSGQNFTIPTSNPNIRPSW